MPKENVRPGMLIYKDVRGYDNATGAYVDQPDGKVDGDDDQVRLSNRSNPYGVTANLNAEWKGLSLTAQISASWGGYSFLPSMAIKPAANLEFTNMPSIWNPDNMFVYQDIADAEGNIVVEQNREGHYPNLAYSSVNAVTSSFWRISGTRIRLNREHPCRSAYRDVHSPSAYPCTKSGCAARSTPRSPGTNGTYLRTAYPTYRYRCGYPS